MPRRFSGGATLGRSAGFQTCCFADFQVGWARTVVRPAGLETRDTADLEVCGTLVAAPSRYAFALTAVFRINLSFEFVVAPFSRFEKRGRLITGSFKKGLQRVLNIVRR